jgi:hypothetical protein
VVVKKNRERPTNAKANPKPKATLKKKRTRIQRKMTRNLMK